MGQKLFVPIGVLLLAVFAGVALYFLMQDPSPRPTPENKPDTAEDVPEQADPLDLKPEDFDVSRTQPDPVRTDRPSQPFVAPKDAERIIVSGRVLDESGAGIADAKVSFFGEQRLRDYRGVGYTDASGFYRLLAWAANPAGTAASDNYARMAAETPEGGLAVGTSTAIDPGGEVIMEDLIVKNTGVIEGQILTGDGDLVAGAQVTVRSQGVVEAISTRGRLPAVQKRQQVSTVFADENGRFRIPNLPAANYQIMVYGGYYGQVAYGLEADLTTETNAWREVRIKAENYIRGTLVDQTGLPLAGAVVRVIQAERKAEPDGEGDTNPNGVKISRANGFRADRADGVVSRFDEAGGTGTRQVTDAAGRFGFNNLAPSVTWTVVAKLGDAEVKVEGVELNQDDVKLTLEVDNSVGGVVRDAETGQAVEHFDVRIVRGETQPFTPFRRVSPNSAFAYHPRGEYNFANPPLRHGVLSIQVSAAGYAPAFVTVADLKYYESRRDIDVSLQPLCDLTLTIVYDGRRLDLEPIALLFDDRLAHASSSSELGSSRIPAVTPATYTVQVVQADGRVLEGTVEVPATTAASIEVELAPAS